MDWQCIFVFFLWTIGVSLIPRGFINQLLLLFFFEGWSRNAHLNSMVFLVLRNIPYIWKQWVLCLPFLLLCVNFFTGKFGSSLKSILNFEGNDEAPIAWLLEAWSGQTIAVETVWDETLWVSDWDFYGFLTVILSLDMARPAGFFLYVFVVGLNWQQSMQAFYKLFLCCALSFYCRCPSPWGWRQEDAEFLGRTWHGVGTVKVFQDMSVTRRRKSGQKQGGRRKVTGLRIHCRFESIATYNLRLAEYTVDICRHWNAVDHLDLNDIVDSTLKSRMWNVKISLKLRLLEDSRPSLLGTQVGVLC